MNGTESAAMWLAGWYVRPDEHTDHYDSRHRGPVEWPQAAAWLREQLHTWYKHWGEAPVATRYIDRGAKDTERSFSDCRAFVEWAVVNRRGRGVWGFDGKRYFYIIHADQDSGSIDRSRLPVDPTTQLAAVGTARAAHAAPAEA